MSRLNYDVLVIGSAPAGESAALNTAKHGMRTEVVERHSRVGDVIEWPRLASAAYYPGRSTTRFSVGEANVRSVDDVPTGVSTIPEISSVGATERELTESCVTLEVGRAFFKETAWGQISGGTVGMLKILFDPNNLKILGVHCFGAEATDIIHIGQATLKQEGAGNKLRYFISTTFNYPAMAETYKITALNGMNRLAG